MDDSSSKRPHKIAIIGMGNVGKALWQKLTENGAADQITVYNRRKEDRAINQWERPDFIPVRAGVEDARTAPKCQFSFTNDMQAALKDSDIVIITTGRTTKPGVDRKDLLSLNKKVVNTVAAEVKKARKANVLTDDAIYVVATNPVDAMTQCFQKNADIPSDKVVGLSGELDRARMERAIRTVGDLQGPDIILPITIKNAQVIGQHGDAMVPLLSGVTIDVTGRLPKPLASAVSPQQYNDIFNSSVRGGRLFVDTTGTSDGNGPAGQLAGMVKHIIAAKNGIAVPPMYCSAFDKDTGVFIGRPVRFTPQGNYNIEPLPPMNEQETALWEASVKACEADVRQTLGHKSAKQGAATILKAGPTSSAVDGVSKKTTPGIISLR
jgi:malate dehydrogenase